MVKLFFRITEEIEDDVVGFFKLCFNEFEYGYYHEAPMHPNENGYFLINIWLKLLAEAYRILDETGYVAIRDIETTGIWLEFCEQNNELHVSIIIHENSIDNLINKPIENVTYGNWKNVVISKAQFKNEIIRNMTNLLDIIRREQPNLLNCNKYSSFSTLLKYLSVD